jgi:tetratricopeptide (TPR) repeat protein
MDARISSQGASQDSSDEPLDSPSGRRLPTLLVVVVGVLLVLFVGGAYWIKQAPQRAARTADDIQSAIMKNAMDLLYAQNNPAGAEAEFRKVLALNPRHYGATYQIAVALDRVGKQDEAKAYWEKMLALAEASKDDTTLAAVRARLAKPPAPSEEATQAAMMNAGIDTLYRKKDAAAAAAEFRKVLERNPTHYGATFQLATALDRLGKRAEARALWEKVLKMAEGYKDQPTLAAARSRLAEKP